MPGRETWFLENRVVFFEFWDEVSMDDLWGISGPVIEKFEQSEAPLVHVIADTHRLTAMPRITEFNRKEPSWANHPKMGWLLAVGLKGQVFQFVLSVIVQLFNLRFRMFDTIEEAYTFLADVDSTLPSQMPEEYQS